MSLEPGLGAVEVGNTGHDALYEKRINKRRKKIHGYESMIAFLKLLK